MAKKPCKPKSRGGRSRCASLKTELKKRSPAGIAKIGGVGLLTPKTRKRRTKKTLVNLTLQRRSAATLARRLGVSSQRLKGA
jgi:hypothetical protein